MAIGEVDETIYHDCPADRSHGITSTCTFEDSVKIGKLKAMKIKNTSDNRWIFTSISVEIDGVLRGALKKETSLKAHSKQTLNLVYLGKTFKGCFYSANTSLRPYARHG